MPFNVALAVVTLVAGCVVTTGGGTVPDGVGVGTGAGVGVGTGLGVGVGFAEDGRSVSASEALDTVDRLAELVAVTVTVSLPRCDPSFSYSPAQGARLESGIDTFPA